MKKIALLILLALIMCTPLYAVSKVTITTAGDEESCMDETNNRLNTNNYIPDCSYLFIENDSLISTGDSEFCGFLLSHDATATGSLITIYDSLTNSGTVLAKIVMNPSITNELISIPDGVGCNTGIYADMTETKNVNISATILYRQ